MRLCESINRYLISLSLDSGLRKLKCEKYSIHLSNLPLVRHAQPRLRASTNALALLPPVFVFLLEAIGGGTNDEEWKAQ